MEPLECHFLRWHTKGTEANFRREREELITIWKPDQQGFQMEQVVCHVWTITLVARGIADRFAEFAREYDAPIKVKNETEFAMGKLRIIF